MVRQRSQRASRFEHENEGMMGRVSDTMSRAAQKPQEMIGEYPISSALVVFGLGVGIGVILGQALCDPLERAFHTPTMAERWQHSMQEAMHNYLPEKLSRRMSA